MKPTIAHSCDWLLIANGKALSSHRLKALAQDKLILVLDGAYQEAKKAGIPIDILLGDFDSISANDLSHARQNITVIDAPDQNKTDLEKGLDYIEQFNPNSIHICSALEGRLQHSIYNLRLLKKYHRMNRSLILLSEKEVIRYYQNTDIIISGKINDCVALLGFPEASITTSGLKYNVSQYLLEFEMNSSISNALAESRAEIKIKGAILVIHESS